MSYHRRLKKEGCNDRFLKTTSQNLFLLGGYKAESDVFQIERVFLNNRWVDCKNQIRH